jgi:hypothetical protein
VKIVSINQVETSGHLFFFGCQLVASDASRGMFICCLFSKESKVCSMRGSNPRPLAHKTNTLPTELMELSYCFY